jgi:hypothetical protein
MAVVLAPALVLLPLAAWADAHTSHISHLNHMSHIRQISHTSAKQSAGATRQLLWSHAWSPPLALLSNYRKCCSSKAGFLALPNTFDALGSQQVTATATFKTRWVDVKAIKDGPNIAQQGRYADAAQFKLQIFHSANRIDHRGQCRIKGATGAILAFGPKIDIADGNWHTITCIKFADTATGTKVVVIVDGVPGKTLSSTTPIGNVIAAGTVGLGGRSAVASSDSLDGWISSISFWLG